MEMQGLQKRLSLTSHRPGFTLVELMVAMTIFVLLATLTISGFRSVDKAAQERNACASFRNALEGARSRALKAGENRGVRLIVDQSNNRIATSLILVAPPEPEIGSCNVLYDSGTGTWRVSNIDDPRPDLPANDPLNTANTTWNDLVTNGSLLVGTQIQIPAGSGGWYTVKSIQLDIYQDASTSAYTVDALTLCEQYQPSTWVNSPLPAGWVPLPRLGTTSMSLPQNYELKLAPVPLPGAQPIVLPSGTCIDLDGSKLPQGWRFVEDANLDGTIDMGETDVNGNGQFDFATGYSNHMDLLFTPRGTMAGTLAGEGVLHFVIASIDDVYAWQVDTNQGRTRSLGGSFSGTSYPYFWLQQDAEKERRVLSIFTQAGGLVQAPLQVNGDTDGIPNNELLTGMDPFYYSVHGRESKE